MRRVGWVLAAALLIASVAPAAAQDESAAIKQGLEASLQRYAKLNEVTLYSYGGIEVAAESQGYAVTIEDLRVAPEESGYLAVGDVRFRLAAEGADFYRVSDLMLPEAIPYRHSDGSEVEVLNLPSQQFSGRWSRPLGILVDADYSYRNIRAGDAGGQGGLTIGEFASTTTSADAGNGRWDTQASFRLGDVRATGEGATFTLAKIEGSGTGRGVDMALAAGLFSRLWTMVGSIANETPPPEFFQMMTDLYRAYVAFDASYRVEDVRFRDAAGTETFALPELTAELRGDGFDRDAGNLDMTIRLNGLRAVDAGVVSVGGLEIRSATRGFKVSEYAKLLEQIQGLAAAPEEPPDPEAIKAMGAMLSISAGGDFEVGLRDVAYSDLAGAELFRLADGAFAAHGEGFDQDLARVVIELRHGGLAARIDDPIARDVVPLESHIGISLENLPVREISSQAVAAFSNAATLSPEEQEMAGMMLVGLVQQALSLAKSQVKLTDWRLRTAAAALELDGLVEASAEAMMGAVARLQLNIAGLDGIIDTVRAAATPEDQDLIAGLDVLRGFSNRETAADGAVIDRYDVNVTPEGQVLINGKPLDVMGSPPPDPTTPPPTDGEGG
jgi:hypothetical protein